MTDKQIWTRGANRQNAVGTLVLYLFCNLPYLIPRGVRGEGGF